MNWEKVKLEDIAQVIAGQSPESKYYNQEGNGLPFFQGKADFGHETPIVRYWCTVTTKIAQPKDILLSVRAPVGPTNICNQESCIGRGLAAIRVSSKLNHRYLYWWFKSFEEKLSDKGNGSTFSSITTKDIKELEVPLPPLEVQKQIADTLDKADELRKKDELLLKKYDELAQAIFYEMFGDPVENEKGWEVNVLGDFLDYIGDIGSNGSNEVVSKNLKMQDTEDYAIMIRTTNLAANDFFKNIKYVSEETYNFFKKSKIYGGEIIMNKIGSAGDFWIMPKLNKPVSLGLNQLVIRLKNMSTQFLFYYLSTPYGKQIIKASLNGAVTKSITKGAVKNLPIICPSLKLQNDFEMKISIIESLRKDSKLLLLKSEHLFNALIQTSFNNDIR